MKIKIISWPLTLTVSLYYSIFIALGLTLISALFKGGVNYINYLPLSVSILFVVIIIFLRSGREITFTNNILTVTRNFGLPSRSFDSKDPAFKLRIYDQLPLVIGGPVNSHIAILLVRFISSAGSCRVFLSKEAYREMNNLQIIPLDKINTAKTYTSKRSLYFFYSSLFILILCAIIFFLWFRSQILMGV